MRNARFFNTASVTVGLIAPGVQVGSGVEKPLWICGLQPVVASGGPKGLGRMIVERDRARRGGAGGDVCAGRRERHQDDHDSLHSKAFIYGRQHLLRRHRFQRSSANATPNIVTAPPLRA